MKNNLITTLTIVVLSILISCKSSNKNNFKSKLNLSNQVDSVSYGVGVNVGMNLKSSGFNSLNYDMVARGLYDMMEKDSSEIEMQVLGETINNYLKNKLKEEASSEREKGEAFLAENGKKEGVVTSESGLQYKIIDPGTGASPNGSDMVTANYKGMLIDGTVFDSSYDRGEPSTFELDKVIPGWSEGLQHLKEGGKAELYIPADLAYGDQSSGEIKPGSTLIFEVELIKVEPNTTAK